MDDLVPPEWQEAAEAVRSHLVMLRGGAPFLSPAEAFRLVGWLEQGVEVPALLLALERAAHYRHQQRLAGKPTRLPFTLAAASRHLGRPVPTGLPAKSKKKPSLAPTEPAEAPSGGGAPAHPLTPVATALEAMARAGDPLGAALGSLAQGLLTLPRGPELLASSTALARDFMEAAWASLDPHQRAAWIRDALPDGDEIDDDDQAMRDAEESARSRLRAAYPFLNAATFHSLVSP